MRIQLILFLLLALGSAAASAKPPERVGGCVRDLERYKEPRSALVIGNGHYANSTVWPDLGNVPLNDAREIGARLCSLGFDVLVGTDLTAPELNAALQAFRSDNQATGVRLIYFSGHGAQDGPRSFLIPVDAGEDFAAVSTSSAGNPPTFKNSASLELVLAAVNKAPPTVPTPFAKIVILDACRSNKSSATGTGLGQPDRMAASGTVVAYATAPGATADAGDQGDSHSLYTGRLLEHLGALGHSLEALFNQVRNEVYAKSGHYQTPWETSSAIGETFYFEPPLEIDEVKWLSREPDDLVIVSLGNQPIIKTWREQAGVDWQTIPPALLKPGDNPFKVEVYNDKTYRHHHPWEPREGWTYALRTMIAGKEVRCYRGGENGEPPRERWGTLFTTLEGTLFVDPKTGHVTLRDVRPLIGGPC
jgi:hypothetical protein